MRYISRLLCLLGWHNWVWINLDTCICRCGKAQHCETDPETGNFVWKDLDTRD